MYRPNPTTKQSKSQGSIGADSEALNSSTHEFNSSMYIFLKQKFLSTTLPVLTASVLALPLTLSTPSIGNAFKLDQGRGVYTLAPMLKKAKPSIVRIQLGSKRWARGKAGPGGIGSGFIVDAKRGLILTNRHVVKGARRIYVLTSNKKSYRARVLGTNKNVDLAVLKIEANPNHLSQLPLGNSEAVEIGDMNIVVGFPFGLAMSASLGMISAGGGKTPERYVEDRDSLQTDAAINPGNSGGPFLNSKGEAVGVNTSILGDNGGTSLGIGFGIPINVALKAMNRILRGNKMASIVRKTPKNTQLASLQTKPQSTYLEQQAVTFGLTLQSLTSHLGVLVKKVDFGSLANRAGLKKGDTIIKIDNAAVSDSKQFVQQLMEKKHSEDKVRVIFKRGKYHYETFLPVLAG